MRNTRRMKTIYFCDVNDGSSHENLQVVISQERRKEMPMLGFGASVMASGKLNVAPKGNLELLADDFQIIGSFGFADSVNGGVANIVLFQANASWGVANIHLL